MKIQVDNTVRDMTPEEEAELEEWRKNTPPPDSPDADEATAEDYEDALTRYANELTGQNDPDLISAAETLITERIKEE